MTVYFNKARERWLCNFVFQGKRHSFYLVDAAGTPVTSRKAALQAEGVARRRAEMAEKLQEPNEYCIAQAVADLAAEKWARQKDAKNKQRYVREICQFFGSKTAVAAISEENIEKYKAWASQQKVRFWMGGPCEREDGADAGCAEIDRLRSPKTVNLYLHVLRQILARAGKVRGSDGRPILGSLPPVKLLPTKTRKARPVPDTIFLRVFAMVRPHVQEAMRLSLYFGFRQGEVFTLRSSAIDWEARGVRLFADGVKEGKDAFLHGSDEAMAFLAELAKQAAERGTDFLVTRHYRGKWGPIKSPKTAWENAMDKIAAGNGGRRYRWHDLRASFITHVALTSGPVMAQEAARHRDFETTKGYIEAADEQRQEAAAKASDRPALNVFRKPKSQTQS